MDEHLQRQIIGNRIIRLEQVGSTNSYLVDLLGSGSIEEGTVVITPRQTAGRGMDESTWVSETGKNLTFSFVLYPDFLPAEKQFHLNMFTAMAVRNTVEAYVPGKVSIKWPNDIFIGDGKAAGILIQTGIRGNAFQYAVIGIGLNINQEVFSSDIPNPVSLKSDSGKDHDTETVLESMLYELDHGYDFLKNHPGRALQARYMEHLYKFGVKSEYSVHGKKSRAVICGIDPFGRLQLEMPDGSIQTCHVKEVEFLPEK